MLELTDGSAQEIFISQPHHERSGFNENMACINSDLGKKILLLSLVFTIRI